MYKIKYANKKGIIRTLFTNSVNSVIGAYEVCSLLGYKNIQVTIIKGK